MAEETILLIDQGGHSSRALLYNTQAEPVAESRVAIETSYPQPGFVEQAVGDILQSVDSLLVDIDKKAVALGIEKIDRAALICQRSSFLACDRGSFSPLTPMISWMDTRNAAWFEHHQENLAALQQMTGLYPNAHYSASKMRWLLDYDAAVKTACENSQLLFVPLAAYLARYLTKSDKIVVDAVIASRTLLMDINSFSWSLPALDAFGLTDKSLPEIVNSDYKVGEIRTENYNMPLQWVGGDQSMVAFSAGTDKSRHSAFANIGSGAFIQAVCNTLPDKTRLLKSPLLVTEDEAVMAMEGTVNAAATALDWLFKEEKELSVADISKALDAETDPPVFCNIVAGTGSPFWLEQGEPFFDRKASLAEKAVAIIESMVFRLHDNLDEIRWQQPGIDRIYISGGLSQYDRLCQKLANISGLPVSRADDPEASARGVVYYLQGKKSGDASLAIKHFDPIADATLKARYEKHRRLMIGRLQSGS